MPSSKKEKSDWNLSVFIAADNDLNIGGALVLRALDTIGSTDEVQILAQIDQKGMPTKRVHFVPGSGKVETAIRDSDTGNAATLANFLIWSAKEAPALTRLALLWSHGGPIDPDRVRPFQRGFIFGRTLDVVFAPYWFAPDSSSMDFLDNVELRTAFEKVREHTKSPFDIVAFEACSMNALEVAYQLRDEARFVIGSQSTILDGMWPHDEILRYLQSNPSDGPIKIGKKIIDLFATTRYPDEPAAISLIDQSKLDEVATTFDMLSMYLIDAIADDTALRLIDGARRTALGFDATETIDIVDFCHQLRELLSDSRLNELCDRVQAAVCACVVHKRGTSRSMQSAGGISIYFPSNRISSAYLKLDYSAKHKWLYFLLLFFARLAPTPVAYATFN